MSGKTNKAGLLKDPKVIDEINRHKWLESERLGKDVGFDYAVKDWMDHYSSAWVTYHKKKKNNNSSKQTKTSVSIAKAKKPAISKVKK